MYSAGRPAVQSSSMKLTITAKAATPASAGRRLSAWRMARMRAYRPGLAAAGIDRLKSPFGRSPSRRLTTPMAMAAALSAQTNRVDSPTSRNRLSQAAMKA
ncbi:hypothetical protein D3C71_1666550 [compost metagenome]